MSTQIQIRPINQLPVAAASDTAFVTLTGTLTQNIVKTLTIPANTLKIGNYWDLGNKDFGIFEAAVNYTGTGATSVIVYMNNAPNLSGSPIQLTGGLNASASTNPTPYSFGINSTSAGAGNAMTRLTSNTNLQNTPAIRPPSQTLSPR